MLERARACFAAQTYPDKFLLEVPAMRQGALYKTGAVRNDAAKLAWQNGADLIAHWDYDDWSAPERLAEQVELLQRTNSACVGYNELPFYEIGTERTTVYKGQITGTSLLYRVDAWEQNPFRPDLTVGEDADFVRRVGPKQAVSAIVDGKPRMIATVHPHNTCKLKNRGPSYREADPVLREQMLRVFSCSPAPAVA